MAAFLSRERAACMAHWNKISQDDSALEKFGFKLEA